MIKQTPKDKNLRNTLLDSKKEYRRIILAKKRRHKKKLVLELGSKKGAGNQKDFWKTFRKISPKIEPNSDQPSISEFLDYFKGISTSSRPNDIPPKCQEEGPLDTEISLQELKKCPWTIIITNHHSH